MNELVGERRTGGCALLMLLLSMLVQLVVSGCGWSFAATISIVSSDLSLSHVEAGLIQGAFAITYALSQFYWAPKAGRWPARRFILIAAFGMFAVMAVQSRSQTFLELIGLHLLIGFFDGAAWIGSMQLIVEWFPEEKRGFPMGFVLTGTSFAIMLNFWLGLTLAQHHGWRPFFLILSVICLVLAIVCIFIIRPGPYRMKGVRKLPGVAALTKIFEEKWIWIGIIAVFGDMYAVGTTASWMIPSFVAVHGMQPTDGPGVGAVMGFAQVVFLIVGGLVADIITKRMSLLIGAFLTLLSALALFVSILMSVSHTEIVLLSALQGVSVLSGGAVYAFVANKYGGELGTAAVGYGLLGGNLASFAGPAITGAVLTGSMAYGANQSGSYLFGLGSFVFVEAIICAALVALFLFPNRKRKRASA